MSVRGRCSTAAWVAVRHERDHIAVWEGCPLANWSKKFLLRCAARQASRHGGIESYHDDHNTKLATTSLLKWSALNCTLTKDRASIALPSRNYLVAAERGRSRRRRSPAILESDSPGVLASRLSGDVSVIPLCVERGARAAQGSPNLQYITLLLPKPFEPGTR